jgi:hypothetical protein
VCNEKLHVLCSLPDINSGHQSRMMGWAELVIYMGDGGQEQ